MQPTIIFAAVLVFTALVHGEEQVKAKRDIVEPGHSYGYSYLGHYPNVYSAVHYNALHHVEPAVPVVHAAPAVVHHAVPVPPPAPVVHHHETYVAAPPPPPPAVHHHTTYVASPPVVPVVHHAAPPAPIVHHAHEFPHHRIF